MFVLLISAKHFPNLWALSKYFSNTKEIDRTLLLQNLSEYWEGFTD